MLPFLIVGAVVVAIVLFTGGASGSAPGDKPSADWLANMPTYPGDAAPLKTPDGRVYTSLADPVTGASQWSGSPPPPPYKPPAAPMGSVTDGLYLKGAAAASAAALRQPPAPAPALPAPSTTRVTLASKQAAAAAAAANPWAAMGWTK